MRWLTDIVLASILASPIQAPEASKQESKQEQRVIDLEQKIKAMENKIRADPKNADLRYDLSDLYYEKQDKKKSKKVFLEGVGLDMGKDTVEDILKPCYDNDSIQKVVYDQRKRSTNFDELVYQKGEKEKMPVLVMFYAGNFEKFTKEQNDFERREAIIFKRLAKKYAGKIKFMCYNIPENDDSSETAKIMRRELKSNNIRAPPSLGMYSLFDLTKGETPEKNDGNVKQVDILRGGPKSDKSILSWVQGCDKRWLVTNIINPNTSYVERFNNSGYVKKSFYSNNK